MRTALHENACAILKHTMWPNFIKLNLFKYSYIFKGFPLAHLSNFDIKQAYKNDGGTIV